MRNVLWVAILMLGLPLLSSCGSLRPESRIFSRYERLPATGNLTLTQEVRQWSDVAEHATEPSIRAGAYLRLALLYSHPDNPGLDYQKAREALETYAAMVPGAADAVEVRRWRNVLAEVSHCSEHVRNDPESEQAVEVGCEANKEVLSHLATRAEFLDGRNRELERRATELGRERERLKTALALAEDGKEALVRRLEEFHAREDGREDELRAALRKIDELEEAIKQLKSLDFQLERRTKEGT